MAPPDIGNPTPVAAATLPDYLTDPSAVLKDEASWRYGRAPDYSNTRSVYEKTKSKTHEAGSLPELVQNLVKNWEVEASFKTDVSEWRTIDKVNYTFSVNGGPPQSAEHMLKVGTYNAVISPNDFYSPEHSDFASSHKTFKRMMPTFAWEVVEVYCGPPRVVFKWRHWGVMKNDYVGFNNKGEKVRAKAHGKPLDIQGITIATVDEKVRLQSVETWMDPLEMFRQAAPNGIVNKEICKFAPGQDLAAQLDDPIEVSDVFEYAQTGPGSTKDTANEKVSRAIDSVISTLACLRSDIWGSTSKDELKNIKTPDLDTSGRTRTNAVTASNFSSVDKIADVKGELAPSNAVVVPASSSNTKATHEEMSRIAPVECPFLMNRD